MLVVQDSEAVSIPLEDISVLVIDNPRVKLSGQLLSACATWQIAVITVGFDHHPNGVLMPYLPHSRALQVMQRQIAIKRPLAKQLWQTIIQQKIANQAAALLTVSQQQPARILRALLAEVKSGDSGNVESLASQYYFPNMFGKGFNRREKNQVNSALNYGYAVIRAALARYLVAYGFITAIGIHHHNQLNSFNLADDLIEPYRALLDIYVCQQFIANEDIAMTSANKATLIGFLHHDIVMVNYTGEQTKRSVLAALEATVISFSQSIRDRKSLLHLPIINPDCYKYEC